MEKQQFSWSNEEWRDPCSQIQQLLLLPDSTNLFFNNTNQGDPFVESGLSPYNPNSPTPPQIMNRNPNQDKNRAAADAGEGSSLSDQIIPAVPHNEDINNENGGGIRIESNGGRGRKRKSSSSTEDAEEGGSKDYIHVRARRGQATDSHSLAERVRREKIGERMKFLQDLVPGCNKVTGKAVMLDEIINYVQSLQRQVEFLSMKMATVNPTRVEFNNMESLLLSNHLSKGSIGAGQQEKQEQGQHPNYNVQIRSGSSFQSQHQFGGSNPIIISSQQQQLLQQHHRHHHHHEEDVQMEMWNDDLHSVVQMGTVGQLIQQQPPH